MKWRSRWTAVEAPPQPPRGVRANLEIGDRAAVRRHRMWRSPGLPQPKRDARRRADADDGVPAIWRTAEVCAGQFGQVKTRTDVYRCDGRQRRRPGPPSARPPAPRTWSVRMKDWSGSAAKRQPPSLCRNLGALTSRRPRRCTIGSLHDSSDCDEDTPRRSPVHLRTLEACVALRRSPIEFRHVLLSPCLTTENCNTIIVDHLWLQEVRLLRISVMHSEGHLNKKSFFWQMDDALFSFWSRRRAANVDSPGPPSISREPDGYRTHVVHEPVPIRINVEHDPRDLRANPRHPPRHRAAANT